MKRPGFWNLITLFSAASTALLPCVDVQAQCIIDHGIAKLLANDGDAQDHFGSSVATDGLHIIIGADDAQGGGAAYLFDAITGKQTFRLCPSDGENSKFGRSVAIHGEIAIVGADGGTTSPNGGAAFLFDTTTGLQIRKLLPDDGTQGDRFGTSVGISGNIAIVGAHRNSNDTGAVYVFNKTTGEQIAKLFPQTPGQFGFAVAISNEIAIIGAPNDDSLGQNAGAAYLFDVSTNNLIAKLLASDGFAQDKFGEAVAVSGSTAIVGAWSDDDNGADSGSAYLFDAVTGQELHKLVPDDGAGNDQFGRGVSISGKIAIVGARWDSDNGHRSGSAYIFDVTTGIQIAKFLPNDGEEGDHLGGRESVAINGTVALAGATGDDDNGDGSGSAYLFDIGCANVVAPNSVLVTHGTLVSGGVIELGEKDSVDLTIRRSTSDIQSRTEFEVKSLPPVETFSSLEVTLKGSVFARSEVTQTIELFDYAVNDWEQIDSREASRFTDSTVTVAATGDLSRFVEPGTMCMKARIRYQSPVARQQFSSNTDQFIWTIGQ